MAQSGHRKALSAPALSRCLPDRRRERFAQPLPIYGDLDAGAFLLQ
jgi:hypothetical protein